MLNIFKSLEQLSKFHQFKGALFIARGIASPVKEITRATNRIARRDLSQRVSVIDSDEGGQLSSSFNTMAESFQNTMVSLDYLNNIIKSMIDTLIVVDSEAKIHTMNPATCNLSGYPEEELIGQPITTIFAEGRKEGRKFSGFSNFSVNLKNCHLIPFPSPSFSFSSPSISFPHHFISFPSLSFFISFPSPSLGTMITSFRGCTCGILEIMYIKDHYYYVYNIEIAGNKIFYKRGDYFRIPCSSRHLKTHNLADRDAVCEYLEKVMFFLPFQGAL